MKRFVLACALSFSLLTPAWASRPALLDSVMGLRATTEQGVQVICTVGKVAKDMFLTAAHCFNPDYAPYFINQHPASLVKLDTDHDLATFRASGVEGKVLKVADRALDWGDTVKTAGWPMGLAQFYFEGKVARPLFVFPGDSQLYVLFDMHVAGGQSGSPVVNSKGELVSVVQVGVAGGMRMEPFSDVSGGALLRDVRNILK